MTAKAIFTQDAKVGDVILIWPYSGPFAIERIEKCPDHVDLMFYGSSGNFRQAPSRVIGLLYRPWPPGVSLGSLLVAIRLAAGSLKQSQQQPLKFPPDSATAHMIGNLHEALDVYSLGLPLDWTAMKPT